MLHLWLVNACVIVGYSDNIMLLKYIVTEVTGPMNKIVTTTSNDINSPFFIHTNNYGHAETKKVCS